MHAVFTQVSISDYEAARKMLHSDLIPAVKGAPGFVAGWWLAPVDGTSGSGVSIEVFESEDAARSFVQQFADHARLPAHHAAAGEPRDAHVQPPAPV